MNEDLSCADHQTQEGKRARVWREEGEGKERGEEDGRVRVRHLGINNKREQAQTESRLGREDKEGEDVVWGWIKGFHVEVSQTKFMDSFWSNHQR